MDMSKYTHIHAHRQTYMHTDIHTYIHTFTPLLARVVPDIAVKFELRRHVIVQSGLLRGFGHEIPGGGGLGGIRWW